MITWAQPHKHQHRAQQAAFKNQNSIFFPVPHGHLIFSSCYRVKVIELVKYVCQLGDRTMKCGKGRCIPTVPLEITCIFFASNTTLLYINLKIAIKQFHWQQIFTNANFLGNRFEGMLFIPPVCSCCLHIQPLQPLNHFLS